MPEPSRIREAAVRISTGLSMLNGWHRLLAAFLLGAVTVAAQPPLHVLPALIVGFTGLNWLMDRPARPFRVFLDGWMFGTGYFAASLYWITNAFLVDPARFGWMIPPAILALSLGFGLFVSAAMLTTRPFWANRIMRSCAMAACWTLFEWARGVVLTGFPWNPIGNVWVSVEPVLQAASWMGVYGLSFVTVFAASAFANLAWPEPRRWQPLLVGMCLLLFLTGYGLARVAAAGNHYVEGVRLRIVQPHIPQREKWRADRQVANLRILHNLSARIGEQPVTHLIWPESAIPVPTPADAAGLSFLKIVVPDNGLLISGTIRAAMTDDRVTQAWNSLVLIDDEGRIAGIYDKKKLVPFGEFVPFRGLLSVDKITEGAVDFSPGAGPKTLKHSGLPPFRPLICYEVIFPGAVSDPDERPQWLLNVTNDGWFGHSSGPYQHFASARMRAVEEGLPMVRAANTGISGVVDSYGRILHHMALGESGYIDADLPKATETRTFYARFGDASALIPFVVVSACIGGLGRFKSVRRA